MGKLKCRGAPDSMEEALTMKTSNKKMSKNAVHRFIMKLKKNDLLSQMCPSMKTVCSVVHAWCIRAKLILLHLLFLQ